MAHSNKYTLEIDGNFMLNKCYFICVKMANTKMDFIKNPEEDKNQLLWKMAVDFASDIKMFDPILNQVVYCVDGSSWRKYYFDDEDIATGKEIKYKGNREKSDEVDWKKVYEVHDEFVSALEKLGVIIQRVEGCEADDLIFGWSSYLNSQGQNTIINSGDNDLIQLVHHDKTSSTIYYNKFFKGFYVSNGFIDSLNEETSSEEPVAFDIFNMPINIESDQKDGLKNIINSKEYQEINPFEFQFKKILIGDKGDNVSPLYEKEKIYQSGKKKGQSYTSRLSEKQAGEILKLFKKFKQIDDLTESIFWEKESIEIICKIAKKVCKIDHKTVPELITKYENNRNLMILHRRALPPPIMDSIMESVSKSYSNKLTTEAKNRLKNSETILEHTSYIKKESNSASSFFGNFDLD